MSAPIGVTLTADDQQLLAVLRSVEGKLDHLATSANGSFGQTGAAAARAAASVKGLEQQTGMSAKAMNAAMRNVPAQFTDIITSLQGGQAPLTVLLQQGGQLKDMFGGILPAFRALGGYALGLVNPFTLAAGAMAALGGAFLAGRAEFAATQRQLILTGGAAGVTAGEMQALAAQMDTIGGATQGRAAEVLGQIAAAGVSGSTALRAFTNTAIELERAGGPAVEETAKAFAALGKDPVQASIELNKQTNFLTVAVFEQIKSLQEQGRTTEAAALAQRTYAEEMDKRLPALQAQLGYVQRSWRFVADGAKEAWDAMLGIGRPDTTLSKLQAAQEKLRLTAGSIYGRADRPGQEQEVRDLSRRAVVEMEVASAKDEQNRQTQAGIKWSQDQVQVLSRQEKLERDITRAREEAAQAGGSPEVMAQMERRIALLRQNADPGTDLQAIRDKEAQRLEIIRRAQIEIDRQRAMGEINERGQIEATTAVTLREISVRRDAVAAELAIVSKRQDSERETAALQGQLALLDAERTTAQIKGRNDLAAAIYKQKRAIEGVIRAQQEETKQDQAEYFVRESKTHEQASLAVYEYTRSVEEQGELLDQEVKLLGATRAERDRRLAQFRIEVELRKRLAEIEKTFGTDPKGAIEKQRVREAAARELAQVERRVYVEEWNAISEDIGRSLTDSLFRAFESGKDFFSTFWSGIKNTFKTTVLKVAMQGTNGSGGIQGVINSAIGSAMSGFAGTASAGGGGGSAGAGSLIGSLVGSAGGFAGDVIGSMMGAGTSGTGIIGSSASASLAAAGPYVAAALALYAVYKATKHVVTPHMGSVVGVGADGQAGTMYGDPSRILDNYHAETDAALRGLGGASVGSLNALSRAFGGTGGFGAEFKFAADGKDASIGSALFSRNGAAMAGGVGSTSQFAFYDKDRETAFKAYTADVARATRSALDSVGLPEWARKQFAALGSDATIEQFAALADTVAAAQRSLSAVTTSFAGLGGVFGRVASLTGDSVMQLAEFAGGMDNLRAQAKSFVENYYNRDEVAGVKAREIKDALAAVGITGDISTREQFRAVVEGVDVATEQGRQQLATLLAAQGSFSEIAAYIEEAGGSLSSLAAAAPTMGAVGGLLSAPEQAQIDAINGVTTAVESVRDAIVDLGQSIYDGTMRNQWGGESSRGWETTVQP